MTRNVRAQSNPRLELPEGWIEGLAEPGLQAFLGIPYAAPPSGSLRWQSPQPPAPWPGVLSCNRFGTAALQAAADGQGHTGGFDCLRLNVWRPAEGSGPWPVMVWVPGGGFLRGSTAEPLYSGSAMARRGVVFVSVGYRLGVDGFMHFDGDAPNRGLQDLLAALQWVQANIARFGGDPRRTTLAGVSAGAGAVAHLLGMVESDGLFDRVILQSPSLQTHDREDAERIRRALAGVLGVAPTRNAIANVPPGPLTQALHGFFGNESLKRHWGLRPRNFFPVRPVVDGLLLRAKPSEAVAARAASAHRHISVVLGCNAEEMRLFHVPGGAIDRIDMTQVQGFADDIGWPVPPASPTESAGDLLCRIQTDYYYHRPATELEQVLRAVGSKTYVYEFRWRSPLYAGRLGAAHGMEIPFALGHVQTDRAREFAGIDDLPDGAEDMHRAWVDFASAAPSTWMPGPEGLRIFQPGSRLSQPRAT